MRAVKHVCDDNMDCWAASMRRSGVQANKKTKQNTLKQNAVYVWALEKDKVATLTYRAL